MGLRPAPSLAECENLDRSNKKSRYVIQSNSVITNSSGPAKFVRYNRVTVLAYVIAIVS